MHENYHAWKIDPKEFYSLTNAESKFRFLIGFAVLAPSSHNSQPWKFEVQDEKVSIKPDFSRALLQSDANHRQLFISIGCALENILVAANYYGIEAEYKYYDEGIVINLKAQREGNFATDTNHLIFSILRRHTDRGEYENTVPEKTVLDKIVRDASPEAKMYFIKNVTTRNQIANFVVEALIEAMDDKLFRKELSKYVKSSNTNSFVGMPGSSLGIPFVMSLVAPYLLPYANISKIKKKQDLELLQNHTPVFGVITTQEDHPRFWIEAGRFYERSALCAERQGLSTALLAAPIQIDEYYKELQKIMNIQSRPQAFFRIGYSKHRKSMYSPRLSFKDIMVGSL